MGYCQDQVTSHVIRTAISVTDGQSSSSNYSITDFRLPKWNIPPKIDLICIEL